jgi:hypothetical protein
MASGLKSLFWSGGIRDLRVSGSDLSLDYQGGEEAFKKHLFTALIDDYEGWAVAREDPPGINFRQGLVSDDLT